MSRAAARAAPFLALAGPARAVLVRAGIALAVLALVTALPSRGAAQNEVPLPDDVRVVAPAPDVPAALAAFSGRWTGSWGEGTERFGTRPIALVVERVEARPPRATVLYAWGPRPDLARIPERAHAARAGWSRVTATFADGTLSFTLGDSQHAYRLRADGTMEARWTQGRLADRGSLRRAPD